ncbi:MAG: hypothetical protein GEV12_02075 [Micromonosporaceae bacterium]|nr:hypothetical protein [Micromonosporaceae bacterium]
MSAKHRVRRAAARAGAHPAAADLVASFGARMLTATDALEAELLAAAVLALPHREGVGPELGELFVDALCEVAGEQPSPESAALLRGLVAVVPPHQRRVAVAALGQVTAAGHYPPEWAELIGRARPGEAWRSFDVFGDAETVAMTFWYGPAAHAVVVQVDRCRHPAVLRVGVLTDVDQVPAALDPGGDPLLRTEPIELADARARLAPALAHDPDPDLDVDLDAATGEPADPLLLGLPVARARLRRLPAADRPAPPGYQAADRAAAVAEFLASPYAAEAGDEKTARFWAEVVAGYSASVPGDPPARIGPLKLPHLLLSYVPNSFALTAEQRRGLPAAVTAWTAWAAQRQGLPEPAQAALRERLPQVLAGFDAAYDDPDNSRLRGYLADLSATTTDAAVLAEALQRRLLAVPLPSDDRQLRRLDVADPAARRTLVEHEFRDCEPRDGASGAEFLAAAVRVCEQLWHDDPPQVWREARRRADAGTPDHEIIHQLAVPRPAG